MIAQTLHLFDLDGTTIDSFHRVQPCLKENGDLDLNRYRAEACKHDLIMGDKLLPLAGYMRRLIEAGEPVGILTARQLSKSDYVYLRQNGLRTALIASRDRLAKAFPHDLAKTLYNSGDAAYKSAWLQHIKATRSEPAIRLYDDHDGVLSAARQLGVTAFDAKTLNAMMNESYKSGMTDCLDQIADQIALADTPDQIIAELKNIFGDMVYSLGE